MSPSHLRTVQEVQKSILMHSQLMPQALLYHDWRELTKKRLSEKGPMSNAKLPKSKMQRAETKVYVKWVMEEIQKNRGDFDDFTKGKGIIATREKFLAWLETDEGIKGRKEGDTNTTVNVGGSHESEKRFGKTIIVPVGILGCGVYTCTWRMSSFTHSLLFEQAKQRFP